MFWHNNFYFNGGYEVVERKQLVQITRQESIDDDEFLDFIKNMHESVWEQLNPPQILTHNLSDTVENNVITPKDTPIPECVPCGACCGALMSVAVSPDNPISSEDSWDVTIQGKNKEQVVDRYVKRKEKDFSCVALDGKIGEEVGCRIYETRPNRCKLFEAGSDRCHSIRRAFGIEPFLPVMEMFEAKQKIEEIEAKIQPNSEGIDKLRIVEDAEGENLKIYGLLPDGSEHLIHSYNPESETWFKSEFQGLTLSKAKDLVATGKQK